MDFELKVVHFKKSFYQNTVVISFLERERGRIPLFFPRRSCVTSQRSTLQPLTVPDRLHELSISVP
jgi:hypothetical protein